MTEKERTTALAIGGVAGALIGVLAGWLYLNSAPIEYNSKTGEKQLSKPSSGHILRVALALLTTLKLISDMGE